MKITLSKYSILADADDIDREGTNEEEEHITEKEESDTEEGEIAEEQLENFTANRTRDRGVTRKPLPRTTKSTYKLLDKSNVKKEEEAHMGKNSRGRKRNSH